MIQNISKYNINNSLDINFKENLVELKGFFHLFQLTSFPHPQQLQPVYNIYTEQCTFLQKYSVYVGYNHDVLLQNTGQKKNPKGLPAIIHIVDMKELTSFTYQCHWFRVGNVCMGRVGQLSLRKKHQVGRSVIQCSYVQGVHGRITNWLKKIQTHNLLLEMK